MNIGQMLTNSARRTPDRTAITWGASSLSYREFDERTNALAHGLRRLGVAKGDRVAVLMRNRPELIEAMFACFKAGFCLVPLNARFTTDEIAYHLGDSRAAAVITDGDGADLVADAVSGSSDAAVQAVHQIVVGGSFARLIDASRAERVASAVTPVDRDDLAWLFYTSGTTGRPKGAMLTHGNLSFVVASWLADLTPMTAGSVTLHAAPLSHGAGFHALAAVARGAQQVIATGTRFEPEGFLDTVANHGVTNTWLVPTQIVMLTDHVTAGGTADAARRRLASLTHVVYGGAPFAPPELRRALETFGPIFVQLFAQGETPMTATMLDPAEHTAALEGRHPERLASAGHARPGMDVRVLGPDDQELPPNEVGEVCVRGPAVMLGYWERPEASAEALRNGWLHTGDLGRMDEHGYLFLLDRAKDMIITGGSNVYAVEVEAALADHAAVRDVAVIGLADRMWGETVVAVVVAGSDTDALESELAAHCAATLAAYKRPRRFVFVDELPRNAYGKVLKRELRSQLGPTPA